ncbi:MAG: M10 family metallopeptidase C-terminal domain-containing protein, partial [Hyphomonadaceae bacterium]
MTADQRDAFASDVRNLDPAPWRASLEQVDTNRIADANLLDRSQPPVQEVSEPSDVIPGNTSTTFTLTLGASDTGVVNTPGDDDWFRVDLVAGQSYVFTLTGSGGTPLSDAYLELRNSLGALIAIDDDAGPGVNSLLRFTAAESGTYFINARAFEAESGATLTGGYTITFNTGPAQNPLDTIDLHFTMPTTNIQIYFATSGQAFYDDVAARDWTPTEISAVFSALATISAVSPLTFSQTTNQASANWTLLLDTDLGSGVLGHFAAGSPGHGAFNPNGSGWSSLTPGSLGWVTLVHEFLHGLGLAHPHDNGSVNYGTSNSEIMQGVTGPFSSYGTFQLNQGVFTTLTYNDGWELAPFGPNGSATVGSQATPMALDIALLQQRYGANLTTNSGGTTYTLTGIAAAYQAIWDTGGVDVIRYDGAGTAVIDLRPATLLNAIGGGGYVSYVHGVHQGFTIANGVVIENAIGGSGSDTLIGNGAANEFTGNGGADTIEGGAGVDTSVYGVASGSASFVRNGLGWNVTAQGVDTLTGVEYLRFSDRTLAL